MIKKPISTAKRVLVTGASGFIGTSCIDFLLEKGYDVIRISSKALTPPFYQLDLLNKSSVADFLEHHKPTHLLHLAWYVKPPDYWSSPLNLDWHEASLHLLKCFYQHGGKRAVVAGTCAEYEWGHPLCVERVTPCCPTSLYGATKLSLSMLSEKITQLANQSIAWARLFHLFGPKEHPKRLVPSIIQNLLKKNKIPCSHGLQVRDYLYVDDAASALVELLDSDVEGPVNIGSGKNVEIREIIDMISKKIGNKSLIQLGAIPGNSDPMKLVPNISRLSDEVGWKLKTDIELALEQTISWWENEIYH